MKSNPLDQLPPNMANAVLLMFGVIMIGVILIYILYLKNLQNLLKNVKPENRKMAPGMVWLLMISFVNIFSGIPTLLNINLSEFGNTALTILEYVVRVFTLVWNFYMVNKIAESISAELASRNITEAGKPTYAIGMFMCACNTLMLVGPYLATVALMAAGGSLVAWIMYWVKTNEYKQKLASPQQLDI
jgi:hypothetical protein